MCAQKKVLFSLFASFIGFTVANANTVKSGTSDLCLKAAIPVAKQLNIPGGLLQAIALKETGRWDQKRRMSYPWPWTVTAGGKGIYFATKREAIHKVQVLRQKGVRNIDVGCMQINLFYHPNAFDNLDQAFNPLTNTWYAADFLTNLYENNGSWNLAIERYHSGNTTRGTKYRKAVIHLKEQAAESLSKRLASPHFLTLADNTSVIDQPKTIDSPRPHSKKSDFYKRREQKNLELRKAFLERKAKVMKRWKDMIQKRKTSDGALGKRQSS
tara:strand:+ start:665 stop:1474 length:810 start_codon:yes stop_codon:yes gene_type:complete